MDVVQRIRKNLRDNADEQVRQSSLRFFKEEVRPLGVKSAAVAKIAKAALKELKNAPKDEVFALCEDLWKSGYLEEGGVACLLAHARKKCFAPADFETFERWVDRYVTNWASCDTLCNHSVGGFVEMYPEYAKRLLGWTASPNRWKKRAAAVSLIVPARKGLFLDEVLAVAEALIDDADDMVQKGYGWLLKAASEAHPTAVYEYLMARKAVMPRTAFRYALEKMPGEWRAAAMKK